MSRERGQATIEYLLVGIILIALMGALASLWHFMESGQMTKLLTTNTSHALENAEGLLDALLF